MLGHLRYPFIIPAIGLVNVWLDELQGKRFQWQTSLKVVAIKQRQKLIEAEYERIIQEIEDEFKSGSTHEVRQILNLRKLRPQGEKPQIRGLLTKLCLLIFFFRTSGTVYSIYQQTLTNQRSQIPKNPNFKGYYLISSRE